MKVDELLERRFYKFNTTKQTPTYNNYSVEDDSAPNEIRMGLEWVLWRWHAIQSPVVNRVFIFPRFETWLPNYIVIGRALAIICRINVGLTEGVSPASGIIVTISNRWC